MVRASTSICTMPYTTEIWSRASSGCFGTSSNLPISGHCTRTTTRHQHRYLHLGTRRRVSLEQAHRPLRPSTHLSQRKRSISFLNPLATEPSLSTSKPSVFYIYGRPITSFFLWSSLTMLSLQCVWLLLDLEEFRIGVDKQVEELESEIRLYKEKMSQGVGIGQQDARTSSNQVTNQQSTGKRWWWPF